MTVYIPIDDPEFPLLVYIYSEMGFGYPYIVKKDNKICVSLRKGTTQVGNLCRNEVIYMLSQLRPDNNKACKLHARFNSETIKVLQGFVLNEEGEQKERAGILKMENINGIYEIFLANVFVGKEEEVDTVESRSSFHTHPLDAYKRNGVEIAWPSYEDYLGFYYIVSNSKGILHCVISVEGIYVISLSEKIKGLKRPSKKSEKKLEKFIKKLYDIPYPNPKKTEYPNNVEEYIELVNSLPNKIFDVQLIPWNKCSDTFISHYPMIGVNCIVNDDHIEKVL